MYVTRPLSLYRRDPSAASLPPPEGPNSGVLVIQDEEAQPTCLFGLMNSSRVTDLPFPQNKNLQVRYTKRTGEHRRVETHRVVFVPVLGRPLSANRYYVIKRDGTHKGQAYRSSTEEDMATFCFCNCISDLKPEPFEPLGEDTYQQFEVSRRENWCGSVDYTVRSVAQDGFPPLFLRRRGWRLHTSTPREFELGEAPGLDSNLRAQLPNFDFSLSDGKSSMPRVVGKWYSPFLFVKESGMNVQDQVIRSRFYEVTLEQQWEPIFRCNNIEENTNSSVDVDVLVEAEAVKVGGSDVVGHLIGVNGGVVWFKSVGKNDHGMEEVVSVGLSKVILERMKWEEERVGWRSGEEGKNRVKKIEEFGGIGMKKWRRFGYFVLAERFVLRRMDGSFVISYEFNHLHQFRTKWE